MQNIWKVLFISLVLATIIIGGSIKLYNSDWFINKTMKVKTQTDVMIGNKLSWDYTNKYEDGKLKIAITIKNVDPKMMNMAKKLLKNEELMKIVLVDKDNFNIKELDITADEFISNLKNDNEYSVQVMTKIDKQDVRKIKDVTAVYRTALDKTYEQFWKDMYK